MKKLYLNIKNIYLRNYELNTNIIRYYSGGKPPIPINIIINNLDSIAIK